VEAPFIRLLRVGDEVHIRWDNRDRLVDGVRVWTAAHGVLVLPVERFVAEVRDFSRRFVDALAERLAAVEAGTVAPRAPVDTDGFRRELAIRRQELASGFPPYRPSTAWEEAEAALRLLVHARGLPF
jgi:hypothetical protein